jgi:hypothetical protein
VYGKGGAKLGLRPKPSRRKLHENGQWLLGLPTIVSDSFLVAQHENVERRALWSSLAILGFFIGWFLSNRIQGKEGLRLHKAWIERNLELV